MPDFLRAVWQDESGQDMVEVTLLIAAVSMFAIGIMNFNMETVRTIVTTCGDYLAKGAAGS